MLREYWDSVTSHVRLCYMSVACVRVVLRLCWGCVVLRALGLYSPPVTVLSGTKAI